MSNEIKCPECGKVVGKLVYMTSFDSGIDFIGRIPCYDQKYDFRRAAHVSFGKGYLCKGCAKKHFPEGIAYKVTNKYGKGRITPYIGIRRSGLFATKEEAQAAVAEENKRRYDNYSNFEEVKI